MDILKNAAAGTLESSDVFITIEPWNELKIDLESVVKAQYGDAILKTVQEVLEAFEVKSGRVRINDHGALDCVIRARMETVLMRGGIK